jgi:carbonic anhydrase
VVIITCMDTRLSIRTLGLEVGDAHIIRNAGGIVTEDVLRSLLISHYQLGTEEFVIINHTDCGMLTFTDEEFRARLERSSGTASISPNQFHAFKDVEKNVRDQMQKLKSHPWIRKEIGLRGFVYDVKTGRLKEILG